MTAGVEQVELAYLPGVHAEERSKLRCRVARAVDRAVDDPAERRDLLCLRSEAPRPDHALPRQNGTPAANLLSVRETEVLTLIAQGLLNKQIADRLQIGLTTVISHRRNIMQKLGVQSVAALVICAVSMGYVDESDIRTPHK